jgi:Tfp pilus assembly protein PilX
MARFDFTERDFLMRITMVLERRTRWNPLPGREEGMAVMIALIALSLFSLIGLYMAFNSTTELRVSDNYESRVQATYAAQAGLQHARELLKGLNHADLLAGPDGTYNNSSSYLAQARTYSFRNPLDWALARSVDIANPSISGIADDGVLNTGNVGGVNGTSLIPQTGISTSVTNPYGSGTVILSRYLVKVTDNNGDATELVADPLDNPFVDGDGIIIIRSMGIAQTVRETGGGAVRANSVAVFEARYKSKTTFNLDSPLLIEGDRVLPSASNMWNGNSFNINGGANVGVSTIDTNVLNLNSPMADVRGYMAKNQFNNIQGAGLIPSITDITGTVSADPDKSLLLDQNYLYNFAMNVVPQFADYTYTGAQSWSGGSQPDLGTYDYTKPYNDPSQDPKTVWVNGDVTMSGNMTGGGLLVVTGKLTCSGSLIYNGLILVIGGGDLDFAGLNNGVHGGIYVVNTTKDPVTGVVTFGTPRYSMSGNSNITFDGNTINMAVRRIPASQIGVREVTSALDP